MPFTCPRCGAVSHHPKDEEHGYCGRCHDFTGEGILSELRQTFDLRWTADQRAIKRWQEAHPGNDLVWPDHADLVVWLLDQLAGQRNQFETTDAGVIDWKMEAQRANQLLAGWEKLGRIDASLAKQLGDSIERNARLHEQIAEAKREIEQWSKAYPLSAFPEPDLAKAAALLKAGGQTLDAVAASNMRHVLARVVEILRHVGSTDPNQRIRKD